MCARQLKAILHGEQQLGKGLTASRQCSQPIIPLGGKIFVSVASSIKVPVMECFCPQCAGTLGCKYTRTGTSTMHSFLQLAEKDKGIRNSQLITCTTVNGAGSDTYEQECSHMHSLYTT